MPTPALERLADSVREHAPSIAVEITEAFLHAHPDWRTRYGGRAMSAGVQDAGYHLAFLASAVEGGEPEAYAAYARWAGRVLASRGIAVRFLAENLRQVRAALEARLGDRAEPLAPYFAAAAVAVAEDPVLPPTAELPLTANVFLQAVLSGQRRAAVQVAREALRDGMALRDLYVDVLQPVLYDVGARWEANRLTVAQEHVATAITQYVMAQIYEPPSTTEGARGPVVLTGVEGELHNVGAVMVGDVLEMSGWRVRFLGTNLPSSSIMATIRETAPTHVGISATMLFNISAVRDLIAAIRGEFQDRIQILVGGAAFRAVPDLWRQVSADAFAPDLHGAQALFDNR